MRYSIINNSISFGCIILDRKSRSVNKRGVVLIHYADFENKTRFPLITNHANIPNTISEIRVPKDFLN